MTNTEHADIYHLENGVGYLTLNKAPPYASRDNSPYGMTLSVDDSKFSNSLNPRGYITASLLPPGTIYTQRRDASKQILVVQEPPMQRVITVRFSGNPSCTCEIDEETGDPLEDCDYCTGEFDDFYRNT